jgi:hypothetical protein
MYDEAGVQAVVDEIQRAVAVAAKRHKALSLDTEVRRVARLHPTALFPLNELRAQIARAAVERQVAIETA